MKIIRDLKQRIREQDERDAVNFSNKLNAIQDAKAGLTGCMFWVLLFYALQIAALLVLLWLLFFGGQ